MLLDVASLLMAVSTLVPALIPKFGSHSV